MGRTSLMMVIVFNMTFMFMGYRLSTASSKAYEKYCSYGDIEQAGLALESAANVAISNALLTTSPTSDTTLCTDDNFGKAKFTIRRILVYTNGVRDGDSLYITGSYPLTNSINTITCTTSVRVRGNAFAQYVFYSQNEQSIQWQTGEVCRGRLHTQDQLYINGNPDFKGRVTTKGGVNMTNGKDSHGNYIDKPNFEQGYGYADISIPTELTDLKKYGAASAGGKFYDGLDVYVEFLNNGSITVRTAPANTGTNSSSSTKAGTVWAYLNNLTNNTTLVNSSYSGGTPAPKCTTYASVAALTSSGVLLVENGELHVKGVLDGQITLGCIDTSKIVSGNPVNSGLSSVWLDGSITYKDPPPCSQCTTNVSNDMLGIVATNDIMVSQYINHASASGELQNVTLDASLFSQTGGFGAENYSGRSSDGTLNIVGGIQQKTRNAVGQNFGANGFLKNYDWDNNLQTIQPKGYPKTPFVVQSWVDNTTIPNDFWQ
jgi:hypothetical protein